ncbi:MAG: hypothetical protein LBQ79_10770 [Deltaproteobacteria bacterium]|jgi:hypothetical protein|nr:hypothetical protein [Deltaproteobacteria bacterium]
MNAQKEPPVRRSPARTACAAALTLALALAAVPSGSRESDREVPLLTVLRDFAGDPAKAAETYRRQLFLTGFRIRTIEPDLDGLWTVALELPPESAGELPPGAPELRCLVPANATAEEGEAARNYRPGDEPRFTGHFAEADGKALIFMCIDFTAFSRSLGQE